VTENLTAWTITIRDGVAPDWDPASLRTAALTPKELADAFPEIWDYLEDSSATPASAVAMRRLLKTGLDRLQIIWATKGVGFDGVTASQRDGGRRLSFVATDDQSDSAWAHTDNPADEAGYIYNEIQILAGSGLLQAAGFDAAGGDQ